MALTRNSKHTIAERIKEDPAFARALLAEATSLFYSGESETSRMVLRALVNNTIGFEELSRTIDIPAKSLHRMLSSRGNPSMDNISAVFSALCGRLKVKIELTVVDVGKKRKVVAR